MLSLRATNPMRSPQNAIYGMFFLSGLGALAFENVWFSQTGLIVGNSVWSAALVAGAFMAGLALGNAAAVPLARRWRNLVRGYAVLEAVAALSGALLVAGFPLLPALFRPLLAPFLDDAAALNGLRLGIAFTLLVIPATALGATLPLLSKPLETLTGNYGQALGRLYGINTLGAVAGTLLAELVLIPSLGLRNSGFFAAACNLSAALIAWRLARHAAFSGPVSSGSAAPAPALEGRGRILLAAFLAGGALLALEVVWFRFLLLFLDGSTLIFAVMLAVVLGGIGLGALLASELARRRSLGGWLSGNLARAAAAGAATAIVASYAAFDWLLKLLAPVQNEPVLMAVALSIFLMGPVALLSGFLFTALGGELRARMSDAGAATGVLTLANTLGAMLGAMLAAFVLLPGVGLERSFFLLALVYAAIVIVIPLHQGPRWRRLRPALIAAIVLAFFPFGKMTGTYYRSVEERFGGQLVAAREGIAQTTFYLSHDFLGEPLYLRLATNSYSMASTAVGGQRYMKLFAYLPAALHPRIERVLLICFGVGSTASALTDLPGVKAIDVVDVSRDILEMSDIAHPDPLRHPLRDPRVSVHIEDARFFLQQTAQRYDLITGEPPPPKMAGVSSLYSREYFELMRDRLNPGGLATYWLPAYLLFESETLSIVRAFCEAFEDCSLWSGLNRDWILMGSRGGIAPVSRQNFSRLWALPGPRKELRRLGIDRPEQLVGQFMADADALRSITAQVLPLEDNYPRRIRSALFAEPSTPRYAWLMNAERGRERMEASAWAARLFPEALIRESRVGFRRRAILEAAAYPDLQPADYNFWRDVAEIVRHGDLVELPRWLLGSGASVAEIAARVGPGDPLAAEHLAIDALANHRRPSPAVDRGRFMALTPKAQVVTIFHHCLAGQPAQARSLMGWISADLRSQELYRSFLSWAVKECAVSAAGPSSRLRWNRASSASAHGPWWLPGAAPPPG
jgi:spermidine synthase